MEKTGVRTRRFHWDLLKCSAEVSRLGRHVKIKGFKKREEGLNVGTLQGEGKRGLKEEHAFGS